MNIEQKKNYFNKGITLVALIITIILLLIISGVAISLLTGEDSILKNTKYASQKSKAANLEEAVKIHLNMLS